MTRKHRRKPSRPAIAHTSNSKSRPISFRLDRSLIEQLGDIAKKLDTTRNHIAALVLNEYVRERGEIEVQRLAQEDAERARQIDLFA